MPTTYTLHTYIIVLYIHTSWHLQISSRHLYTKRMRGTRRHSLRFTTHAHGTMCGTVLIKCLQPVLAVACWLSQNMLTWPAYAFLPLCPYVFYNYMHGGW